MTLGFGFEPGLKFGVRILRRVKELLDAGKRTVRGCRTGLDGLVCTVKVIPRERLNVGAQNQVRVAFPNFELMLLGSADCSADHLKDVGGSAAMSIFDANRNGDDVLGAEIARGARRNLRDKSSIG
jgi:hypothetical protein